MKRRWCLTLSGACHGRHLIYVWATKELMYAVIRREIWFLIHVTWRNLNLSFILPLISSPVPLDVLKVHLSFILLPQGAPVIHLLPQDLIHDPNHFERQTFLFIKHVHNFVCLFLMLLDNSQWFIEIIFECISIWFTNSRSLSHDYQTFKAKLCGSWNI